MIYLPTCASAKTFVNRRMSSRSLYPPRRGSGRRSVDGECAQKMEREISWECKEEPSTQSHAQNSSVWARLGSELPQKRASYERPNRPCESLIRDAEIVNSPSFAQWASPTAGLPPDPASSNGFKQRQRVRYCQSDDIEGTQSVDSKQKQEYPPRSQGNKWGSKIQRRERMHDELLSHDIHIDSKDNILLDIKHLPTMQVKTCLKEGSSYAETLTIPRNADGAPPISIRPLANPRNANKKAPSMGPTTSAEPHGKIPGQGARFFAKPLTNHQHGNATTKSQAGMHIVSKKLPKLENTSTESADDGAENMVADMRVGESLKEDLSHFVMLIKDNKPISRTQCNAPVRLPYNWNITQMVSSTSVECLSQLTHFLMDPAFENSHQMKEWGRFLNFLYKHKKVAIAKFDRYEIYILPPEGGPIFNCTEESLTFTSTKVAYRVAEALEPCSGQKHAVAVVSEPIVTVSGKAPVRTMEACVMPPDLVLEGTRVNKRSVTPLRKATLPSTCGVDARTFEWDASVKGSASATGSTYPCSLRSPEAVGESKLEAQSSLPSMALKNGGLVERNFVRTDPSYLRTLGQAHSGWIFGAIAELVDNARDANAKRLDILIETIYDKSTNSNIPMLSVIDDGHGMTHQEICRMISFGHKQPDGDDPERIGKFGIGFKTGAMRLGRDALVLTQTADSRSIAFLSQSLNEGKDNLEIPVVSYCRQGQYMELDKQFQSEELAEYNLKAIKDFSPFNEYLIGEKAALFHENPTGTQIYIWNLDKWGSDYTLEWQNGKRGGSSFYQGDIFIRSRRVRSRPGQTSRKVPLDYSLRSYLEVIFLDPRMKIYVQGSLVKSRPLAKSLSKTIVNDGIIMGQCVQLTLGRCQLECEQGNGGIFLYWHGRLIEAYKRVGGMIHSADIGRGVIGVIDVTNLMDDKSGCVYVHNNKQGFQDCEPFAQLEEWLAERANEYWDTKFDPLSLKKSNALYKPDHEWVQCDKCRKWRMLSSGFNCNALPAEWFCYMEPFNGKCDIPEQEVERGIITVSSKRCGYEANQVPQHTKKNSHSFNTNSTSGGNSGDASSQTEEEDVKTPSFRRLKRGRTTACTKK
ncbi:hypothetical protein Ancab_003059 [Ancistrocladus abbreviatus]